MKTPVPFRFDGHGINDAEGQRIAKVSSCEPYVYPAGQPQRNSEFDELSNLFASAPELLAALKDAKKELEQMHAHYCKGCKGGCPTLAYIDAANKAIGKTEGK
jgi:hypothetical protein